MKQGICGNCDKIGKVDYYCPNCASYVCKKCGKSGDCPCCAPKLKKI